MNPTRSKINLVKSRIAQIETSDLFSEEEKRKLLNTNRQELETIVEESFKN